MQPAGLCRGRRGESPRAPASCPCSAARGLPVPRSGRQWVQAGPQGSALPLRVGPLCYCREASRPAGQELSCQQRPAWAQGRRPLGASSLPGGGGGARPHFQCGSSCRHLPLSACHRGQGAGPARHPVTRLDRQMPSAECSPPTRPCRVNVCLPWGSEGATPCTQTPSACSAEPAVGWPHLRPWPAHAPCRVPLCQVRLCRVHWWQVPFRPGPISLLWNTPRPPSPRGPEAVSPARLPLPRRCWRCSAPHTPSLRQRWDGSGTWR